ACYQTSSLTNQQWSAGTGFSVGDKIVLIVTAYSDGNCTTPDKGSSPFSSVTTTTSLAAVTFTGPGNFSDTTKWSASAVPLAGQDFVIVNSCTFDSGSPARAYGNMTLGSGATAGTISWQSGNGVTLEVNNVASAVSGGSIDMSNAGTLRIDGTVTTANITF